MIFTDKLELGKPRRTREGYLAVRAKAARSGVYDYLGSEVDPEGKHFAADQVVKVYRPADEVFAKQSVHSFLLKPITEDHPSEAVTADNWRQHAKGVNAGAMRDGEHLAFDLVVMDASAIQAIENGKKELSNGYACKLDIGDGVTPDGTEYNAVQRDIVGNHVALVPKGRAGPECRIGDAASCDAIAVDLIAQLLHDSQTYSDGGDGNKNGSTNVERQSGDIQMPHTLIIDGLQVTEVSDQAKAAIEKLQGEKSALADKLTAAETKVGELTATVATKDGEIAALEQKVKDAAVSPEQLEQMAADRAALIATAKAVEPNVVTDGKSDAEIRQAVVAAKLGDAAKDMADEAIAGAFKVLTKDVKPAETKDALRATIESGSVTVGDARSDYLKDREKARQGISNAWRRPANEAAA